MPALHLPPGPKQLSCPAQVPASQDQGCPSPSALGAAATPVCLVLDGFHVSHKPSEALQGFEARGSLWDLMQESQAAPEGPQTQDLSPAGGAQVNQQPVLAEGGRGLGEDGQERPVLEGAHGALGLALGPDATSKSPSPRGTRSEVEDLVQDYETHRPLDQGSRLSRLYLHLCCHPPEWSV